MTPERRNAIRQSIETAKRHHAKRSHLQRELVLVRVNELKAECPEPTETTWPTALGSVLHELAHLASACAVVGAVLAAAAVYSGVK